MESAFTEGILGLPDGKTDDYFRKQFAAIKSAFTTLSPRYDEVIRGALQQYMRAATDPALRGEIEQFLSQNEQPGQEGHRG